MSYYLNPDNKTYQSMLKSETFVDKSELIAFTNECISKWSSKNICVSQPRRFGKTINLSMLAAYYSRDCDSKEIFDELKISEDPSYEKHLNKYDVIKINMHDALSAGKDIYGMIDYIKKTLLWDFDEIYPDVKYFDRKYLDRCLEDVYRHTKKPFIFLIDNYDCVFQEYHSTEIQNIYLKFLKSLFKDKCYTALVYMTGVLPVRKAFPEYALDMFCIYSMENMYYNIPNLIGFTEDDVQKLCQKFDMNINTMRQWYGNYYSKQGCLYCPLSVSLALQKNHFGYYWLNAEPVNALTSCMALNIDGFDDAVKKLIDGETVKISTRAFQNDMAVLNSRDDILTLLVHLGYLGYIFETSEVYIPNKETREAFLVALKRLSPECSK